MTISGEPDSIAPIPHRSYQSCSTTQSSKRTTSMASRFQQLAIPLTIHQTGGSGEPEAPGRHQAGEKCRTRKDTEQSMPLCTPKLQSSELPQFAEPGEPDPPHSSHLTDIGSGSPELSFRRKAVQTNRNRSRKTSGWSPDLTVLASQHHRPGITPGHPPAQQQTHRIPEGT